MLYTRIGSILWISNIASDGLKFVLLFSDRIGYNRNELNYTNIVHPTDIRFFPIRIRKPPPDLNPILIRSDPIRVHHYNGIIFQINSA